jgi:hypothetical protein
MARTKRTSDNESCTVRNRVRQRTDPGSILRETRPIYSGITNLIAFMLDPEAETTEKPDEYGDRNSDWCRA